MTSLRFLFAGNLALHDFDYTSGRFVVNAPDQYRKTPMTSRVKGLWAAMKEEVGVYHLRESGGRPREAGFQGRQTDLRPSVAPLPLGEAGRIIQVSVAVKT